MANDSMPATKGFRVTVTPYLCVKDAARAIVFYENAFSATEVVRLMDGTRISHAEIRIGDVAIFISEEYPEIGVLSPQTIGGSPVMMVLNVEDVDAVFDRAVSAGATVDRLVMDRFDGALRNGKLVDPFGHRWMISTSNEDFSPQELQKRA